MKEPASKVAGLSYTGLILAIALGYILFGEELNTMTVLGMLLIIGAIGTQVYLDYEWGKESRRQT
jgi:drug/metabolite transporter (DMT)-like permease